MFPHPTPIMKHRSPVYPARTLLTSLLAAPLLGQIIDAPDGEVAGIPANYTEAKAGWFELPDPLMCNDGTLVTDTQTWVEKRRPEIFALIETNQYGRVPPRPRRDDL